MTRLWVAEMNREKAAGNVNSSRHPFTIGCGNLCKHLPRLASGPPLKKEGGKPKVSQETLQLWDYIILRVTARDVYLDSQRGTLPQVAFLFGFDGNVWCGRENNVQEKYPNSITICGSDPFLKFFSFH